MTGFREILFQQAREIVPRVLNGGPVTHEEGRTLRQAWECAKVGNVLIDAIHEVWAFPAPEEIQSVIHAPGFLTTREKWHTSRLRRRAVVAYRGCEVSETIADKFGDVNLGLSWTLDRRVAEFFAGRLRSDGSGRVVTAKIRNGVWLDTKESEVIGLWIDTDDIINIEPAGSGPSVAGPWESVRTIAPRRSDYIKAY